MIFQTRDNTKAMTVSRQRPPGMTGTIYAPAAAARRSAAAASSMRRSIVDTLTLSGNGVANAVTLNAPAGTVAYTPAQIRAAYGINSLVARTAPARPSPSSMPTTTPSIYQALDAFDSQFGLTASGPTLYSQYGPASSFLTVLNQYGQATSLPATDPSGPGTDNWEVEEALDVEWAHAIAPGAQIILVEANSQSLSDLMAGVATAASQPGVSVVSMSWGFAEGQAVFASDEATYDSVFNVPGVTFVASTGDYGAADPEYPAFSPNVVAVGGTSLTLNADNSYNSETGWGYQSDSVGAFIGSGGGLSLYEPEPAYQQGVQSTGSRTTPDVSLVADPATGAWIADPYNLDPSNPFEVVGGTSLSAPAWAGLLALVNQGRAAAGESTLNSTSPTETQQALYMLPQSDYNVDRQRHQRLHRRRRLQPGDRPGNARGQSAGARPGRLPGARHDLLGPDRRRRCRMPSLVNTGTSDGGPIDVFSVFDSFVVTENEPGSVQQHGPGIDIDVRYEPPAPGVAGQAAAIGFTSQTGHAFFGPGWATNPGPAGLMPRPTAGVTGTRLSPGVMFRQPAWSASRPGANPGSRSVSQPSVGLRGIGRVEDSIRLPARPRAGLAFDLDPVLDELAADRVSWRGPKEAIPIDVAAPQAPGLPDVPIHDRPDESGGVLARLAFTLLAAGFYGHRDRFREVTNRRTGVKGGTSRNSGSRHR